MFSGGAPSVADFLQPLTEARSSAANSPKQQHFMRIAREVVQKGAAWRKGKKPPGKPQMDTDEHRWEVKKTIR